MKRPHPVFLLLAVTFLCLGVAGLSKPHGVFSAAGFYVAVGAGLLAWYVDQLARWLK